MAIMPSSPISRQPRATGLRVALALAAALATAGCASGSGESSGIFQPYRFDLPQGNYVTSEMLDQVRPGMTREQVRAALGTPLLDQMFRTDRWDYVYRYTHPSRRAEQRSVTIYFEDDRVARIRADELPLRDDASDPALPGVGSSPRAAGSRP